MPAFAICVEHRANLPEVAAIAEANADAERLRAFAAEFHLARFAADADAQAVHQVFVGVQRENSSVAG